MASELFTYIYIYKSKICLYIYIKFLLRFRQMNILTSLSNSGFDAPFSLEMNTWVRHKKTTTFEINDIEFLCNSFPEKRYFNVEEVI